MPTTSGTVATTVWTQQKVIDNAFVRCRVPTAKITAELLILARDALDLQLKSYVNDTIPLWCVDRILVGLTQNMRRVTLPPGSIDIENMNLRTPSQVSGTDSTSFNGVIRQFATPQTILTIGILATSSITYTGLIVEYSDDGVNFSQLGPTQLLVTNAGLWSWFDTDGMLAHQYIRVRDIGGGQAITSTQLFTGVEPMSVVPFYRMNQDDYSNLPSRWHPGRPLQYWTQRKVDSGGSGDAVHVNLYYPPDLPFATAQLEIFRHRYIQDPGTFQNVLEVPLRWYRAVIDELALEVGKITPDVPPDWLTNLERWAGKSRADARMEERDAGPIRLQPDIRRYTR